MGTDKPRIQVYIEPQLYQAFKDWRKGRGIDKDSLALNELIKEYLGVSEAEPNYEGLPDDRLRILIQEELWSSGRQDFIEGIKVHAEKTISKAVAEAKEYWQAIDQKDEIKRLTATINQLRGRVEALEKASKPIEAIREISNKLHSPPNESLNCSQLARRLGVNHGTISKNRGKPDFEEWTKGKDPDAIAWKYDREKKLFSPKLTNESEN
jgi:hypothetical protein